MRYLVSTIFFAAGLAACAPTSPSAAAPEQSLTARTPNRCFNTGQVANFRFDNTRLFVRSQRNVHEITFIGACRLGGVTPITINNWTPSIRQVCVGDRVTVTSRMQRGVTCQARVARSLTDEQLAALPARARP